MITDEIKSILYDHATRHLLEEKSRDKHITVTYDKADVEHIAYWFKVDFDELDRYWRTFLGIQK